MKRALLCVFCERSLAIFKSLDLKPLKASMGLAGNNPVFLCLDAVFPGRSKPELRSIARAHHSLVIDCGMGVTWELVVEGKV